MNDVIKTECKETEKLRSISILNIKGKLESVNANIYLFTLPIKHFFENLQEPIIQLKTVKEKLNPQIEWFKCICIANLLPNEHNDTPMHLNIFFQYFAQYKQNTNIDAKESKRFATSLTKVAFCKSEVKENLFLIDSTARFLFCLIENRKTSDVYNEYKNI